MDEAPERRRWFGATASGVAMALVVLMTAYASFVSQQTSSAVDQRQKDAAQQVECTTIFLNSTVAALGQRTSTAGPLNKANQDQLRSLNNLFLFVIKNSGNRDPSPEVFKEYQEILTNYSTNLQTYLGLLEKTDLKRVNYPYPTVDSFKNCLVR